MTVFVFGFARAFLDAFVLWRLWGWFVVPLGVRPIGYWHAYGLDLLIGFASLAAMHPGTVWTMTQDKAGGNSRAWALAIGKVVSLLVALGVGYAAHLLMVAFPA